LTRVSGAFHGLNSRQNDQTNQKGKNRVDGRHGKIRRGVLAEISDRKHFTLGNKPILATFSDLLSAPGFSRLACKLSKIGPTTAACTRPPQKRSADAAAAWAPCTWSL
jgi:hypothetical protein